MIQPNSAEDIFYAYQDPQTNAFYFHNPITNEHTWVEPTNATVLFGDTMAPFQQVDTPWTTTLTESNHDDVDDDNEFKTNTDIGAMEFPSLLMSYQPGKRRSGTRALAHDILSSFATPDYSELNPGSRAQRRQTFRRKRNSKRLSLYMTLQDAESLFSGDGTGQDDGTGANPGYFPSSINTDQNLLNISDFAKEHFYIHKKGSLRKKSLTKNSLNSGADELLLYDENVANIPLLKETVEQKLNKQAVKLFNFVLAYGRRQNDKQTVADWVEIIWDTKNGLVDEAYMQLIKQTRNNPSPECNYRTWELILVMTTLFLATPSMDPVVRQILATAALGQNKEVARIAQLAYLRYDSRRNFNSHLTKVTSEFINKIPSHMEECHYTMGVSLQELMWRQRRIHPKLRIPKFFHEICHTLVELHVLESDTAFQLPGNKVHIDEMVKLMDDGKDFCKDANLSDLASLFKRWLGEMPTPIVPMDMYPKFLERKASKDFLPLIDEMPFINRDMLAYLVGFLKEYVNAQPSTKPALSRMLGTNIMRYVSSDPAEKENPVQMALKMKECSEIAHEFMSLMLCDWDTTFMYPLDESTLN